MTPKGRAYWLLGTVVLVWLMIMLGGATRLTHAGLSIVEWKPVTGIIPPLSHQDWLHEFELYKQFPEFKILNPHLSLDEFKFIFFMEYAHRLLGRLIGLWFALPLFLYWKGLSSHDKKWGMGLLALGAFQGFLGWYMVKSGLIKDPAVSPFRLMIHLLTAFFILFFTLRLYLREIYIKVSRLGPEYHCASALLLITICYGALVAGFKAGLIYNTYPLMGGQFFPSDDALSQAPLLLNFVNNPAAIQWLHRWLAFLTVVSCLYTCLKAPASVKSRSFFMGLVCFQFMLGILTLLYNVPVFLGTLHQGVAALVFISATWFGMERQSV